MRQERGEERNKASSAVLLSALQPGVRAEAHAKGPVLKAVLIPPGAWSLEPGTRSGAGSPGYSVGSLVPPGVSIYSARNYSLVAPSSGPLLGWKADIFVY